MATKNSDKETVVFTCLWKIENFRLGDDIYSPRFTVKMLRNSVWILRVESGSINEACVLLMKCGKKSCMNISFAISLLKADGSTPICSKAENQLFGSKNCCGWYLTQENIQLLLQEAREQNGTITLIYHMWNGLTVTHNPAQCYITTRLVNKIHVFKLPIEKFSSLAPGDERDFSFSCINFGQPQIDMNIHLKVDEKGCLKCNVQKNNPTDSPFWVHCKMMTTTKEGLKTQLTRITSKFLEKKSMPIFGESLKINISTADKEFDLSDNVLILHCELEVGPNFKTLLEEGVISSETQAESTEKGTFSKMDDLMHFFKEKRFYYVTLRTANKEFAVHKALLCARSPVFRAMFESDMTESDSNIVDIDDVDSDTISLLLNFLHLEPVVDLKWEAASELFYAADKYQIEELKSMCVCFLTSELTVENVCEALSLSDMHHSESLKHNAQKFFCKNSGFILRSKEWNEFLMSRTELAGEVLRVLADKL